MSIIQLDSRIQMKQDTEANWTSNNPVLLNGETVISLQSDGTVRKKTGNGTSNYNQLNYDDEYALNNTTQQINTHNSSSNPHANMGWVDNLALKSAIINKADKAIPSVSGNVALLNSSGNLQDSGKGINDLGTQITAQTITLTTSGWTQGSDNRYYQTKSVTGINSSTPVVWVDCDLSTSDTDAKVEILTAWAGPSANEVKQGYGTLTFYSYEVPTINIPVNVGVG